MHKLAGSIHDGEGDEGRSEQREDDCEHRTSHARLQGRYRNQYPSTVIPIDNRLPYLDYLVHGAAGRVDSFVCRQ